MRMLLAGVLVALVSLAGCSDDGESAEDAAGRLAGSLESGKLAADLFGGSDEVATAQSTYDEITNGLGDASPSVDVGDVTEKDGAAEVTLAWSWKVDGSTWNYDSTAALTDADAGWHTTWEPALVEPSLTPGETLRLERLPARRGDILGAGGVRLVTERPVVRFGIDKTKVPPAQAATSARRAAQVLGVSVGPFVKTVRAAGDQAFVEAIVLRPHDARAVDPAYSRIRGAVALDARLPLAPTRDFAAPILGRVGPVTAERVEQSAGRLEAGDVAGLSGLQARYDEQLTGTAGVEVQAVGEDGSTRSLFKDAPV